MVKAEVVERQVGLLPPSRALQAARLSCDTIARVSCGDCDTELPQLTVVNYCQSQANSESFLNKLNHLFTCKENKCCTHPFHHFPVIGNSFIIMLSFHDSTDYHTVDLPKQKKDVHLIIF